MNRNELGDLVGDSTHELAAKSKDALQAAGDYLAPRARDLADYLAPRVRDLAENITEYLEPRARDLGQRGAHFAHETAETLPPKVAAFASDARATLQPKVAAFASDTRDNFQPYLEDALSRVQPRLDDTLARVQPLVDSGRDKLTREVIPLLTEAYDNVAANPTTQEAKRRLTAAAAALAGDLALPEPEAKKSAGKTVFQVILAFGLLAGVAFAIRRFLAPVDSGWQAHSVSDAYRPDTDADETEAEPVTPVEDESGARHAAEDVSAAPVGDETDPFVDRPYGEGSFVGAEPPEGFAIKGNERSMKFHVQGAGGYDRTIADVWFDSEAAAEAAGFTKAQR